MPLDQLPFGVAHHMALVPLVWLLVLHARGNARDVAWWWLGAAYAVSWLADTAAHVVSPWLVSAVYPVTQAGIVGAVLLDRRRASLYASVLVLIGVAAVLSPHSLTGPDLILRSVAWGAVAYLALHRPELGRLSVALFASFGVTLVAWWGYAFLPGWATWSTYQTARLVGIALFCYAAARGTSTLRLLATDAP